jgi:starch synthase
MEIWLVSSEFAPWVQFSGVAEVVASFSKTLKQVGHSVTAVVPYSNTFETAGMLLARRLTPLAIEGENSLSVFDTQLTSGVQLVLVCLDTKTDCCHDLRAAALFARAVAALIKEKGDHGTRPDIVHVHDWFGGLVGTAMAMGDGPRTPVVFTVYDVGGQANVSWTREARSELGPLADMPQVSLGNETSILAAALRTASRVTTTSDAYARMLGDAAVSGPIADVVRELSVPVSGIPLGIDYSRFNPAIDPLLVARYDAEDFFQKRTCKTALQRELGLELDQDCPLFFVPGPLTDDVGGRLVSCSLLRLLDQPVHLVIAIPPNDEGVVASTVQQLAQQWPRRLAVQRLEQAQSLHRAMSAADFVLLAARRSPLEVYHLFAQRYGAVPVASAAGFWEDYLVDCDAKLETGSAFLFDAQAVEDLVGAVARAVTAWRHPVFDRLRRRTMRQDLGWERPTRRMVQVYRQILGVRL